MSCFRIIELGKLEIKTAICDKRMFAMETQIRRSKNKAGVLEQRVVSCTECGEEFCTGNRLAFGCSNLFKLFCSRKSMRSNWLRFLCARTRVTNR